LGGPKIETRDVTVEVREESVAALADYARVPSVVHVKAVLDVIASPHEPGGYALHARSLDTPYLKDYDSVDGGPASWVHRFDLSGWGVFSAFLDDVRVGGAVIAFNDSRSSMLEGRVDLAVLWDIRVRQEHHGRGVGGALLATASAWARARGCRDLKVETQNVNPRACQFYARHGFVLRAVERHAYRDLPDEIQLLWYKSLA
jgi:GNAT superfamily N-acetyltransferase